MVIEEIEIFGFKSFANRTKIKLMHELTAIVGPNGCGKSNILDAIKWVLGEKSVRSMRGEKMEDVIFSGTETKKAANFAEVIITINNKKKFLNLEHDIVKIGRRLYRDGQSHYFINDKRVSRKDIEHLLLDTGLGKSAYSFMEQGRMDMILSSKPEDRRYIFEEAAGISRYKAQKEEAEKNLESTQFNITRLQDILHELERELKIKESQAEKTRKYNSLREKLREHDLRIRYFTLREIDEKLEEKQKKLERKQAEVEKIRQKILLYQQKIGQIEQEDSARIKQLHTKDLQNQVNRERIFQLERRLEKITLEKKEKQNEMQALRSHLLRIEHHLEDLKKAYLKQSQLTLELQISIEDHTKSLHDLSQKEKDLQEKIHNSEKEIQTIRQKLRQRREKLKAKSEEITFVIQELLLSLHREKSQWLQKEMEFQNKKNKIVHKLESLARGLRACLLEKETEKMHEMLEKTLQEYPLQDIQQEIESLNYLPESLRHLLFDKEGIFAQKESLSQDIHDIEKEIAELEAYEISEQQKLASLKQDWEKNRREEEVVRGNLKAFEAQHLGSAEREKDLKTQIEHEEMGYRYLKEQFQNHEKLLQQLDQDYKNTQSEITKLKGEIENELARMDELEKNLSKSAEKKAELNEAIRAENEKSTYIAGEINELEVQIGTLLGSREVMLQDIYNDYNLTSEELREKLGQARISLASEKEKLVEIRRELEALGPINPLALEELKAIRELYDHHENQLRDIRKAKEDLLQILRDIDKKSEELFLNCFYQVEENFRYVFRRLFYGGDVSLTLTEKDRPLYSGIEIQAQPPGKRPKSLRLLSGGEKALTAIALMFAIYMVRSSPLCVLDEIDAPLDDHNVSRFLELLDEFRGKTQFLLITHHKKTMAHADAIFGVTMEEPGVSRILSVEIKKEKTMTL